MNIIDKIWNNHVVKQKEGHPAIFAIDLHLMHEVTSAQAFETLKEKGLKPFNPQKILATIDHSIPTTPNREIISDPKARNQIENLRKNCQEFKIPLFDINSGNQGVIHVIAPELGAIHPGMTIVCGDSHTSTHGAFGAIAFGIGTTEVGLTLASSCILQKKPKTMKIHFKGKLKKEVSAKDLILALIRKVGTAGGTGYIAEFTGEAIEKMSMEERMTICNMSIEFGARSGLIAPDQTTYNYLKDKRFTPKNIQKKITEWEKLKSDKNSPYDQEIEININTLDPMVTWGTSPEEAIKVTETIPSNHSYTKVKKGEKIEGIPINWAFIGSCTNGRIEDFRNAAKILKGNKIHKNVTMYAVPGSEGVKKQAEKEGLDKIFKDAGADWRMPGCSMCLAMNEDKVPAGKRCISTSNRNFVGRQGPGSITHLASPSTVAASAINGIISNPLKFL